MFVFVGSFLVLAVPLHEKKGVILAQNGRPRSQVRIFSLRASQVGLVVKSPPANPGDIRDSGVQSLGWEDPLEKGMATHSSILAWRIPRTEEPGGPQSIGSQRVGRD